MMGQTTLDPGTLDAPAAPEYETLVVEGVAIANTTADDAVRHIVGLAHLPRAHQVCFVDARAMNRARTDYEYHQALLGADRVWAGGGGFRLAGSALGGRLRQSLTLSDLVPSLCTALRDNGLSLYLLGGEPGTGDAMRQRLEAAYPGLQVVGTHDGYFAPDDEPGVIDDVAGSQADVLLVGLGRPREDLWIAENQDDLGVRVAIGAGSLFAGFFSARAESSFGMDDAIFLARAWTGGGRRSGR